MTARVGDVIKLKQPVQASGWLSRRTFMLTLEVEVREIRDGKVRLLFIAPDIGTPLAEARP